jgi:hypothetical protein
VICSSRQVAGAATTGVAIWNYTFAAVQLRRFRYHFVNDIAPDSDLSTACCDDSLYHKANDHRFSSNHYSTPHGTKPTRVLTAAELTFELHSAGAIQFLKPAKYVNPHWPVRHRSD